MNNFNEGFYVWVPSNSPSPSGVANKPQQFTVALQHTEQLQGKWEVALTEIHYPNNWFNVKEDVTFRIFYDAKYEDLIKQVKDITQPITAIDKIKSLDPDAKFIRPDAINHEAIVVPAGYYSSIYEIIAKINSQSKLMRINKDFEKVFLEIVPVFDFKGAKKTYVVVDQTGLNLLAMLGILPKHAAFDLPIDGTKQPSLEMHFPALYIYCNFIDVQYVGNERASILRIVPILGKVGEYAHKEFVNRYYLTLSTGYINSISFEIRDDTGLPVKFLSGKVTLGLHFRPKRI